METPYKTKIGHLSIVFENISGYQDVAVVDTITTHIKSIKPVTPSDLCISEGRKVRKLKIRYKLKVLSSFGTRLLIRVAETLLMKRMLLLGYDMYVNDDLDAVLIYILDVLEFRSHKSRYKDVFINSEFSPRKRASQMYFSSAGNN